MYNSIEYRLSGAISLLSPEYLLSLDRCETTGSLTPAFATDRPVGITVKLPYAFALYGWFPISRKIQNTEHPHRLPKIIVTENVKRKVNSATEK